MTRTCSTGCGSAAVPVSTNRDRAIYEKGGLNLAHLTDEQQIEAEDDYRICVRRGTSEESKPKRQRRKPRDEDEAKLF